MSGVFLRPILNNEPVLKRKRGNDYAAAKSPDSPEAPEEDATMAGQGASSLGASDDSGDSSAP